MAAYTKLVGQEQIGNYLGISPSSVSMLVRNGEICAYKTGKVWHTDSRSCDDYKASIKARKEFNAKKRIEKKLAYDRKSIGAKRAAKTDKEATDARKEKAAHSQKTQLTITVGDERKKKLAQIAVKLDMKRNDLIRLAVDDAIAKYDN